MANIKRCFGRWTVEISEGLRRELENNPELLRRLEKKAKELERDLNTDPYAIYRLLQEPMVHRELRLRRLRIGDYRVLFEILVDKCKVRFLAVGHRRSVYRNLRRRRG